jgi:predicted nucleic-acid-binding Zn-ribbon protein
MTRTHKDIKCPVCGNAPFEYQEISYQSQSFAADDSGIDETGVLEPSNIKHVIACCGECKHEWKLRGISQIDDLRG